VRPFAPNASFVEFDSTLTHTDNALRTLHGSMEDTILAAGLNLDYRRQGTRLDLRARGNINWVDYIHKTYASQALGFFDGLGALSLLDQHLVWTAEETFGQALRDPFTANTPANLEKVNILSTGPRLTFGEINRFTAFGLYSRATYGDPNLDNHSLTEGLALAHYLSPFTSVSANVVNENVRFDTTGPYDINLLNLNQNVNIDPNINPVVNTANRDYQIEQAFGRYQTRGGRTTIVADVGVTQLKQHQSDSKGGMLVHLDAARAVTGTSSVYFAASREWSTAQGLLRGDSPVGAPVETSTPVAGGDVFLERSVSLGWALAGRRNRFSLDASWRDETHQQLTEFNRRLKLVGAQFERKLRPTLTGRLLLQEQFIEYRQAGTSDHETFIHGELAKRYGRRLQARLAYDRYERHTPEGVTDYGENQISVSFVYTMIGAY
jgi:hypothetical protein